jgi:hypothetical protein
MNGIGFVVIGGGFSPSGKALFKTSRQCYTLDENEVS